MADDSGPPPSLQKVRAACKKRGATGVKGLSRFVYGFFHFNIYGTLHSTKNSGTFETGVNGLEIFSGNVPENPKIVELRSPERQKYLKHMGSKF